MDFAPDVLGSEKEFTEFILRGWYFKGLGEGHTIELLSQAATIDSLTGVKRFLTCIAMRWVVREICEAMISERWGRGERPGIISEVIP